MIGLRTGPRIAGTHVGIKLAETVTSSQCMALAALSSKTKAADTSGRNKGTFKTHAECEAFIDGVTAVSMASAGPAATRDHAAILTNENWMVKPNYRMAEAICFLE